jgi:hypothetical protein
MRAPISTGSEGGTTGLASPTIVVILVLMLGATIYLWRTRYLRPTTAYVTIAILVIALFVLGTLMYTSPA